MVDGHRTAGPEGALVHADHSAYVAAIGRKLAAQDIATNDVYIGVSPGGRREAAMRLEPDVSVFPDQGDIEASMSWDEEFGWSLLVRFDAPPSVAGSPVCKGFGVLPDPDDVASWVVTLLTRPDATPSREDGPYRDCSAADPAFEAQLGRYSATAP